MAARGHADGDVAVRAAARDALREGRALVVQGPPGSGVSRAVALAAEAGLAACDDAWRRPAEDLPAGPAVFGVTAGLPPADPVALARATAGAAAVVLPPAGEAAVAAQLAAAGSALDPAAVRAATHGRPALVALLAAAAPAAAEAAMRLSSQAPPEGGRSPDASPGDDERASRGEDGLGSWDASPAAPVLAEVARWWGARLALLPPVVAGLLEALVVLGDGAPLWLAAELAGASAHGGAPAGAATAGGALADVTGAAADRRGAAAAADTLVAVGILRSADPLRVAQPLTLAALAAAGAGARRDAGHRAAATLLARTADGLPAAAAHLRRVPAGGDPAHARLLRDAARAALAAGDADAAAAALARALEEPLAGDERAAVLVELGEVREPVDAAAAIAAYEAALPHAVDGQLPRVHLRLGRARYGVGDYRGAGQALERGVALVDPDDPLRTELLATYVAAARFDRGMEDAAARHLAPLLDREDAGRTAAERNLLAELALERGIRGYPRDEVVGLALRAWGDGLLLDGDDPYGIALSGVAAALTWSDAYPESDAVLSATIAHAERAGDAQRAATARYLRSWPRWYVGRLEEAEADVRAALGAPGWEMYEPSARAVLGHVLLDRGEPEQAWAALALERPEAWETTVPYAMLLEARARLHVAGGDLDAAVADLEAAGALLETMGNRSPFCPWRSALAVVRARLGEPEAAAALVATEHEQAAAIGTPRALGTALHARALVAALAQGAPPGTGQEDLEAAVAALTACDARPALARARFDLGRLHGRAGRPDAARTELRLAHELATEMGARRIAEAAAYELRRAGGRVRAEPEDAAHGLTAAELRVARLVAIGRTNRQVAEALYLSPHTVRYHLAAVYRKLGVTGRDGIAAALQRG